MSTTATKNGQKPELVEPTELKPPDQKVEPLVKIDRLAAETLLVPIIGTSPLIVHRFSEKAKKKMLDGFQGKKNPKESKDPEAEYLAAFYHTLDGGNGLPVRAFKAATVSAARFYDKSVTMTALRQFLFFHGEIGVDGVQLAVIEGEPKMREDVVTVGVSGHDLRYRPQWDEWKTELRITYVASALTRDSVLSLIDAGGLGVGVAEWRPEKSGEFGTYQVDLDRPVEVL